MLQTFKPLLLVLVIIGLVLSACGPTVTPTPDVDPDPQAQDAPTPTPVPGVGGAHLSLVQSDVPRETAPAVSAAALSEANRAFALDLYQALRAEEGNLFYSPYSISTALAMAFAGADGATRQQMADALRFTLAPDAVHPAFNALDLSLTSPGGEDTFRLNVANALWAQADYDFLASYLDTLAMHYGAGVRLADFTQDATREEAREAINAWISDQTEGKIEELLQRDGLSADSRLVLLNAIYFKGEWVTPFDGGLDIDFALLDGDRVSVPAMSRRVQTPYVVGDGFEAFALEYKGERARMVVLVPDVGTFDKFEQALDADWLAEIMADLQPTDVQVTMPTFEFDSRFALRDALVSLGMADAFAPGTADFSGMDGTRDLFIQSVVHQAYVAVDEEGTEAAAATGITVGIVSMPMNTITVDRPFIFAIHDVETDTLLFVGRVVNPLE